MKFTRITVDPKQMGGVPCIRGLRIPAATVVGMVADGMFSIFMSKNTLWNAATASFISSREALRTFESAEG
jgi:Protein of unknown function (DUF433)